MTHIIQLVILIMKKTTKEDQIIIAAEKLFEEYGYQKVSIDEIVKKAKVAKGTFYLYFKNKDELYISIIEGYKQHGHKCMGHLIHKEQNLRYRLYLKLVGSLIYLSNNKILKEILLENENYYSDTINKKNLVKSNLEMMKRLLGQDYDKLRSDIDIKSLANINTFFLSLLRYKTNQNDNILDFAKKLAKVIVDGVLTENTDNWGNLPNFEQIECQIEKNIKSKN